VKHTRRAALLPVSFFDRSAESVAAELLGAIVVSRTGGVRTAGRIVETEAYLGTDDPASHAFRDRKTPRNAALFGPPSLWYVYFSYGVHWCTNLVCERAGKGSAVLLRALEPLEGLEVMRHRRRGAADRALCAGPGRLSQALGIDRTLDGTPMRGSKVEVHSAPAPVEMRAGPRVGITKATDWPLRFWIADTRWVSRGPVRPPGEAAGGETNEGPA
jgi:DNA-3-methyladenine glycosylase